MIITKYTLIPFTIPLLPSQIKRLPIRPPRTDNIPLHTAKKGIRHFPHYNLNRHSIHLQHTKHTKFQFFFITIQNWLTAPFVCSSNAFLSSVTSSPLQYAEITSPPDVITVDEYPSSCSSFWVHPAANITKTTTNTKLTLFFIFCPFWQIRKKQPISGCFISTSYPSHRFQLPLSLCQTRIPMFPAPSFVPKIIPISPYLPKKTAIM